MIGETTGYDAGLSTFSTIHSKNAIIAQSKNSNAHLGIYLFLHPAKDVRVFWPVFFKTSEWLLFLDT